MGFFTTVETASVSEAELLKSLQAGYQTDSAQMVGGRTLIPEDIEGTMVNAMREQKEDCKFVNSVKKKSVNSTIHEYNRRTGVGNYKYLTTEEGGGSETSDQELERKTVKIKYLQDRRAVTDQMALVDGFEDAYTSEKIAGTLNVLKAAEYFCFHGDETVVPTQFDGVLRQIEKSKNANIYDVRGKSIATVGERIITDPVGMIFEAGGDANKLFFPPILAQDIQDLIRDRIRFGTSGSGAMNLVVDQYPTPYGSTIYFGQEAGADKFFHVKGLVTADGSPLKRPKAPTEVTTTSAADGKSKFAAADAGNYKYTVHSVNKYGISDGKEIDASVAVSAGHKVTLKIKASAENTESGYVICRSAKDGDVVMEMVRIGKDESGTTEFNDFNIELPGTAQMVFLTEKKIQEVINWDQFCPLRSRPLYESNRAEIPFLIQLFAALDVKAPEWCAIAKNIAYRGGLYY
ncbi:SU10 major capsid protein [Treponema phagedenis]|uniref:Uncharacterized protein n=1 Tax=Treponema phagedenis TaxID=162 RepID=A0AAE6IU06_TREPH|nr:hypothetical protein [Treponema phagedenis]NVP23050.1 hypothetical protein [Treponema phagedenis]QEJ94660.1 hypothetical protein FUT79_05215 [Treponema phagedenis]QEJ95195.1 hypothetical protein FUT79_08290 [Treponema phagedenis]QEJ95806.1 hypothetical protein FUT79_11770 [Treponema phagedenis]QEJ97386.1 hypothetical protein FUT82_04825 [Treponema phagedenis]